METTMSNVSFRLYNIFRNTIKVEEKEAQEASTALQEVIQEVMRSENKDLATKDQITNLEKLIMQTENRVLAKIADQYKWLFGALIAILGILIAIYFKK
jgi:cysteinyl-tRNA synthetase